MHSKQPALQEPPTVLSIHETRQPTRGPECVACLSELQCVLGGLGFATALVRPPPPVPRAVVLMARAAATRGAAAGSMCG